MNDYQLFVFGAGLDVLRLKIVDLSLNMSSKKRKSSCPRKHSREKCRGEGFKIGLMH